MIARRDPLASSPAAVVSDQYVVAFGKSGGLGCFTIIEPLDLVRGERVVVRTPRGDELGQVLGPATLRQARLIGTQTSGEILRRLSPEDEALLSELRSRADALYQAGRASAHRLGSTLQILDVELLLDDRHAIVQFLGGNDAEVETLAGVLRTQWDQVEFRFENLASPDLHEEDHAEHGGCGKPDCGKTDGGGCTSCSTGGCSSCGANKVDLRPYFAHLREKMEENHRTPLL